MNCDLSILNSLTNCEEKEQLFADLIRIGLDNVMPLQISKLHFKVDVKSVLRIGHPNNKRGHSDFRIIEIPHFPDFFLNSNSGLY